MHLWFTEYEQYSKSAGLFIHPVTLVWMVLAHPNVVSGTVQVGPMERDDETHDKAYETSGSTFSLCLGIYLLTTPDRKIDIVTNHVYPSDYS